MIKLMKRYDFSLQLDLPRHATRASDKMFDPTRSFETSSCPQSSERGALENWSKGSCFCRDSLFQTRTRDCGVTSLQSYQVSFSFALFLLTLWLYLLVNISLQQETTWIKVVQTFHEINFFNFNQAKKLPTSIFNFQIIIFWGNDVGTKGLFIAGH